MTRREATRLLGGAAALTLLPISMNAADTPNEILKRAIPSTDEKIPAVGLGTSGTFDVGDSVGERGPLREVLRRFVQLGGKVD